MVKPDAPAGFSGKVDAQAMDIAVQGTGRKLVAGRPDVIFHLAAVVSGEAETDFEKGYRINLVPFHELLEAIRCAGGGYHPKLVFTSSIAVFGAPFPSEIPDDFHHTPLTSYGAQKGICELLLADYTRKGFLDGVGIRLADHLRAARQAEQGGLGVLLQHHPRAAGRARSGAARAGKRDALARQPALGGRLPDACGLAVARDARAPHQSHHAGCRLHGRRADRGAAAASPATTSWRASAASRTPRS